MSVVGFVENAGVRYGLVPTASVLATSFVRARSRRRPGGFRLDPEVFAVGPDLMVLALFTIIGVLADGAAGLHALTVALKSAESTGDAVLAAQLADKIDAYTGHQLVLAFALGGIAVATYGIVDFVHAFGHHAPRHGSRGAIDPELRWFRGTILPLAIGLSAFVVVLVLI